MGSILFKNGASSLLAASIGAGDLTIQVASGDGAKYPSPGVGEYFIVAIEDANGALEYCRCTSRLGDLLTVTRGQESTAAQSWTVNQARVELRNTAGQMGAMVQKAGDTMTGDLDMDGNDLQDARLTGDTVVAGGQLVGTAIRGVEDDASNEILVPNDGTRATAGGSRLITESDNLMTLLPIGTILMWYGSLGSLPTGWQNCDGTNGSPDMRDRFPTGAGGALALGATGGAATASGTTGAAGGHTHTAAGDAHVLTEAEMPAHNHRLWGDTSAAQTQTEGLGSTSATETVAGRTANVAQSFIENAGEDGQQLVEDAGSGAAHSHTVTVDAVADHTHTLGSISTLPPYKAVYFIMKVS